MGVGTKTSAVDVAKYLIALAASEDEPESLSPMRLQKLLYYVQGWSLAERNVPMFVENIQAWAHGPVVPEVYRAFKDCGRTSIPEDKGDIASLTELDSEFVRQVWDAYKGFSAIALSDMTHSERPWKETRGTLSRDAKCEREIGRDLMREYFKSQAEANGQDKAQ